MSYRNNRMPLVGGGYFFSLELPKMYPNWNTVIVNDNNEINSKIVISIPPSIVSEGGKDPSAREGQPLTVRQHLYRKIPAYT